jgi:hypothetical protein
VIDARTTRHLGPAISQRKRKLTEDLFGCGNTIGRLARPCGAARTLTVQVILTMGVYYDLIQLPKFVRITGRTMEPNSANSDSDDGSLMGPHPTAQIARASE